MTSKKTKGRNLSRQHATDVEKWDILDMTLRAPLEEKLAISVEELTILVRNVKRKQQNLPNLDGKRNQKERKGRSQSGMWEVKEKDKYAFTVNSATSPEKMDVTVGGVVVEMLIDSGASTNVIDKNLWSKLKQEKIKFVSRKSNKKLYAYGSTQPLNVLGTFSALVRVKGKETEAEFVVINGKGVALLERKLPYS